MPLVLVPVIGLAALVTFVVMYGMLHNSQYWLQSEIQALSHPHGSFLTRAALKALGAAAKGVLFVVRAVEHALSVAASHVVHPVANWIDGLAGWIYHGALTAEAFSKDVAFAFTRLVQHTIPHAVKAAIAVPLHEVTIGIRDLRRTLDRLRVYARGIDRLAKQIITHTIPHAVARVEGVIGREISRERARARAAERALANPTSRWVKAIWRRGWILVGAGLMVKFLAKKFPYLFCRNSTNALKAVCGLDSSLLDALLLDAVAIVGVISVVEMAEELQGLEDEALAILKAGIKEL